MKTNLRKFLILPLLVASLSACGSTSSSGAEEFYEGYYSSISKSTVGPALLHGLHDLMIDTHFTYPTYASFKNYIVNPNAEGVSLQSDTTDHNKTVLFYTNGKKNRSNTTNTSREHVWACANSSGLWTHNSGDKSVGHYVDDSTYRGGGSDLHHIRLANYDVNTGRQNYRFGEIAEGATAPTEYRDDVSGPYSLKVLTGICEVDDHVKGDLARILMYVYVHYSSALGKQKEVYGYNILGTLSLQSVIVSQTVEDAQATLIRWNELDPVDDFERLSNEYVFGVQKNRNPFIDHPEMLKNCFNLEE